MFLLTYKPNLCIISSQCSICIKKKESEVALNEKNISTEQKKTPKSPRFQSQNENGWR